MVHNLVQLPFAQSAVAETSGRLVALSLSTAAGGQRQYPLRSGQQVIQARSSLLFLIAQITN